MPGVYFADTSALLPRFLRNAAGHAWMRQLSAPTNGNLIAIAEITEAEIASAINQLARGRTIRQKTRDLALATFWDAVDAGEYHIIPVTSTIVRRAADLSGVYSLKGYDAIQLACALALRDEVRAASVQGSSPLGDPIFLTEDNRLAAAAAAEGFTVDGPVSHP